MPNTIKALHIIDDQKFISYCKHTFDIENIDNSFVAGSNLDTNKLSAHYHCLFIHYLNPSLANKLVKHDIKIPIIWFFWGADGYLLAKFNYSFLLKKTLRLRIKQHFENSFKDGFKYLISRIYPNIFDKANWPVIRLMQRFDAIVPIMPDDYELLKAKYQVNGYMHHLNYVNPIFSQNQKDVTVGDNILLGNSATFWNNHIEAIDILSDIDLGQKKVYIPLSYGDKWYAEKIKNYANKKLPGQVICLLKFMPLHEYQKILNTCMYFIMNHIRQQALGNIVMALMSGAHVYLHPKSSITTYLEKHSFCFSSINNINNLIPLTNEQQKHNKKQCELIFGKAQQHQRVIQLFNKVLKEKDLEQI